MTLPDQTDQFADMRNRLMVSEQGFLTALTHAAQAQLETTSPLDLSSLNIVALEVGVSSGTAGVWKLSGDTARGEHWKLVLKGLQNESNPKDPLWDTTSGRPSEPFHWRREASAYQSGILQDPGVGGVRAPRFYGLVQSAEGVRGRRVGVFMEDARGIDGKQMSLGDFGQVAYQLGRMQAHFTLRAAAGADLNQPWLSKGYVRAYVDRVGGMAAVQDNEVAWRNPLMRPFLERQHNGQSLKVAVEGLFARREEFLDLLDSIPTRTLAHNDLWYGQLVLIEKTVLMDAAALGDGPLGLDIGKLMVEVSGRDMVSADEFVRIENVMFTSYLNGLAAEGMNTDDPQVRGLVELGWKAGIAAGESYRLSLDIAPMARDDERAAVNRKLWVRPEKEVFNYYADRNARLLTHAERALELATELAPLLGKPIALEQLGTPAGIAMALAAGPAAGMTL